MTRKNLTLTILTTAGLFLVNSSSAVLTELRFSEIQMTLGTINSVVSLAGGEYTGFGITTVNTYRYADNRDPFSDGAENLDSLYSWGLSPDYGGPLARVNLLTPVTSLEVDWWTITGTLFLDVYDTANNNIHSFTGASSGTEVINAANISYFTFHDDAGFVAVSNIRFSEIPEPGALTFLLAGLAVISVRARSSRTSPA
jgi:hypothetical protein